ncbi:MAG: glycosyltransferase family protein [Pedobacter sp.]|uniref:glycosyltransferase family protein n=1 Tax=Pedobacter sp. TaxID=1411316 RepID=UPI002809F05B|nr:glycosyltransferase family protein [Pedobacter sp.]MDQ8003867.1 glycosyltransferase family protein [Pedobacter sp.]
MKILYAIQGTGNGHVSRAREIVPLLQQHGEVDLLISGTQVDVKLAQEIKYNFHGFSFIFGKKGGVDHYKTWKNMNLFQFKKDMNAIPLSDYNLILNDFEPISAWACKLKGIESVSLSHQASFKSKKVPRPKTIDWGKLILSRYAPTTHHIGFHFDRYDDFIYKPVIRSEIRQLEASNLGHYTVYLPAIDDKDLVKVLKQIPQVRWEVFSKHTKIAYADGNVFVEPVNNEKFNQSMASCEGVFTGGGFEGPAEALHLGKKLLVAPMRFQYEQQCNAYALKQFGLPVIWGSNRNWVPILKDFVAKPQEHKFDFPDETASIIAHTVNTFAR